MQIGIKINWNVVFNALECWFVFKIEKVIWFMNGFNRYCFLLTCVFVANFQNCQVRFSSADVWVRLSVTQRKEKKIWEEQNKRVKIVQSRSRLQDNGLQNFYRFFQVKAWHFYILSCCIHVQEFKKIPFDFKDTGNKKCHKEKYHLSRL